MCLQSLTLAFKGPGRLVLSLLPTEPPLAAHAAPTSHATAHATAHVTAHATGLPDKPGTAATPSFFTALECHVPSLPLVVSLTFHATVWLLQLFLVLSW